jgi:hypothetical protein
MTSSRLINVLIIIGGLFLLLMAIGFVLLGVGSG